MILDNPWGLIFYSVSMFALGMLAGRGIQGLMQARQDVRETAAMIDGPPVTQEEIDRLVHQSRRDQAGRRLIHAFESVNHTIVEWARNNGLEEGSHAWPVPDAIAFAMDRSIILREHHDSWHRVLRVRTQYLTGEPPRPTDDEIGEAYGAAQHLEMTLRTRMGDNAPDRWEPEAGRTPL